MYTYSTCYSDTVLPYYSTTVCTTWLLCTIDGYKILKAAATSPVLKELKLDEAHNRGDGGVGGVGGVGEHDLLNWGRILPPAVLKAVDEQLLPGAAGRGASQNLELLCRKALIPRIHYFTIALFRFASEF